MLAKRVFLMILAASMCLSGARAGVLIDDEKCPEISLENVEISNLFNEPTEDSNELRTAREHFSMQCIPAADEDFRGQGSIDAGCLNCIPRGNFRGQAVYCLVPSRYLLELLKVPIGLNC
jgi:hypothetical protein